MIRPRDIQGWQTHVRCGEVKEPEAFRQEARRAQAPPIDSLAYLLPNLRGELRTCTLSGLSSSAWLLALSQSLSRRAPEPQGFILTTILGIVGAFVATYLGQAIGWYGPDQGAGLIGAIVGAVLILLVWGFIDRRRSA